MSSKLKNWCYWLSLVAPIYDIVRGACIGIYNCYVIAKTEREHNNMVKKETEMFFRFREDNKNE